MFHLPIPVRIQSRPSPAPPPPRTAIRHRWLPAAAWLACGLLTAAAGRAVLAANESAADPLLADRADLVEEFLSQPLEPVGGYLFAGAEFPAIRWSRPHLVQALWGAPPPELQVRWFNGAGEPVKEPAHTGRYAALVEVRMADGSPFRRGLTLFRFDPAAGAAAWSDLPLRVTPEPRFGLTQQEWDEQRGRLLDFTRQAVVHRLLRQQEGAILVAGLADAAAAEPDKVDAHAADASWTPEQRHQRHHWLIRRQLDAADGHRVLDDPALERPLPETGAGRELVEGDAADAGFRPGLAEALDQHFQQWHEVDQLPFTAVVARRGLVAFHAAYGERDGKPVDLDTVYPLFSISKSVSGIMTALFLDSGLLELDQPLARVLPDLPEPDGHPITVRSCLMHVSGLEGHPAHGGIDNPWLDNVVANAIAVGHVRHQWRYSGTAYDLVGMAMQQRGGMPAPDLFQRHLFGPLGMRGARVTELGSGIHLRAIDLAKLGQLMINGGGYGDQRFFSPATRDLILPQAYVDHFPDLPDVEARSDYGLGIRWAAEAHPRAGEPGVPDDAVIPSARTIGHGALSGSVYRVDLQHGLIVAIGRQESGTDHGRFLRELLALVAEHLDD